MKKRRNNYFDIVSRLILINVTAFSLVIVFFVVAFEYRSKFWRFSSWKRLYANEENTHLGIAAGRYMIDDI